MATKLTMNQKATKAIIHVALSDSLNDIAAEVAGALQETTSLSETLGELTIKAGKELVKTPANVDAFIDACKQMSGACGLTEGSVKAYMTHIRSVIRAMIAGYKPKAGATLRSMYDAAPKSGKGGAGTHASKSGARHATDKPEASESDDELDDDAAPVATVSAIDRKRAALVELFGHADDELIAAISWAAAHELRFTGFVKAQIAFDAAPSKAPALRKAA